MRVIVIGGGIGGLSAAVALQRVGIDARVYEAAARLETVGKGIWVATNAMQVLERLGLAAAVTEAGWPLERIELRDRHDGLLHRFDLADVRARYGHTTVSVHRGDLQRILAAPLRPGTLALGRRCVGFAEDRGSITARFHTGEHAEGDVLIGADGVHSAIRATLFPGVRLRYAGQTSYRGIADLELPADLAHACWEVWGGESRFGFSALGRQRVYWFAPITAPPRGGADAEVALPSELARRYASFPAPIGEILARTPADEIMRTDLYDFAPMRRWCRGATALLGDAAHAMTPNLGQGGAQAIEDAFVLAGRLAAAGTIERALREYERLRVGKVRSLVRRARQYGQVAHLRAPLLQRLRNRAMRARPEWLYRRELDRLYALDY